MNHHAANPTIADKKVRSATHYEKRQVFIPAKSNQCAKRVLALRLDPKLRRAAYAQRSVFCERLIKTDVAVFAYNGPPLFINHELRRQKRQLLVSASGSGTQSVIHEPQPRRETLVD